MPKARSCVWSAGIIHEMNNPLNFARTGLYALRNTDKHLPESERAEFKDIVADVEEGIKRVYTIVSDLRTYAHPGRGIENEPVPLADVVGRGRQIWFSRGDGSVRWQRIGDRVN